MSVCVCECVCVCDFISVLEDVFSVSLIFCIGVCVFADLLMFLNFND